MKTLIAVLVTLVGNVFAFLSGRSSATNKIKAEAEEAKAEYQQAGYDALIGGWEKEKKISDRPVEK